MLCFFCESDNHLSDDCKIYSTNKARILFLRNKKCCTRCLGFTMNENIDSESCEYCIFRRKCYTCFSKSHYTIDCADELTVSHIFPPNIDDILVLRFMKFLMFEEKLFLLFTYPKIFTLSKLTTPFKITYVKEISFKTINQNFYKSDLVVADKFNYQNKFIEAINELLNSTTFRIKNLELFRLNLSADELLKLLSEKIKILSCSEVKIYPKLTLRQILIKVPNLEELYLTRTNIEVTNAWLDDLRLLNYAKFLNLEVPEFEFDVGSLAALMKDKNINVHLLNAWPMQKGFNWKTAFDEVTNKLTSHFMLGKFQGRNYLQVSFLYGYMHDNNATNAYTLKNY